MFTTQNRAEKRILKYCRASGARLARIITNGPSTDDPWLGSACSRVLVLTIMRSERWARGGGEGSFGFIRLPYPRVTASGCFVHPEELFQAGCIHGHARDVTVDLLEHFIDRYFRPAFIVRLPGDHQLYQTAKSWFQGCLTYRNNSFSTPLIPNNSSHGAFSLLFEGCPCFRLQYCTCWLSCSCRTWRLRTIIYICLMEHCGICACPPRSCPLGSAFFVSLYAYCGLSAHSVWPITLLATFRNRSHCTLPPSRLHASRNSLECGCERRWYLSCNRIFPRSFLSNTEGAFIMRANMVILCKGYNASFSGFRNLNPYIMIIGCNDWIFQSY